MGITSGDLTGRGRWETLPDVLIRFFLQALDDLIEKKRNILETVKETKTFKEAKEILEKYDDMPVEKPPTRPSSQVNTPTTERRGSRPPPPPPGAFTSFYLFTVIA